MIRRLLVLALAVMALMWWSRRVIASVRGNRATSRPAPDDRQVKDLGPMVRDRVCNTFLPRSRALMLSVGSEEHFFCSEKCRQEFRSHQPVSTA